MNLAVRTVLANADANAASILPLGTCGALNEQRGGRCLPHAALPGAIALVLRNALQLPTPNNIGDCAAVGRSRPARDGAGGGGGGGGGAGNGGGGGSKGRAALPQLRRRKHVIERWPVHELEVLIAAVRAERRPSSEQEEVPGACQTIPQQQGPAAAQPPGKARRINISSLAAQLGLDPDDVRRRTRLRMKVNELRTRLDNGEEISSEQTRRIRDRAVHWVAWSRKAFLQMPGYMGTGDDVCAALLGDPHVAPLLDHRVDASRRRIPRWRRQVLSAFPRIPGLVKTGTKKGGLIIYRYDLEAAELLAAAAKARRRSSGGRRAASMPHLGLQQ